MSSDDESIRVAQVVLGKLFRERSKHQTESRDDIFSFEFCCPEHVIVTFHNEHGTMFARFSTRLLAAADDIEIVFTELKRRVAVEVEKAKQSEAPAVDTSNLN